jgi:hypothetical protein
MSNSHEVMAALSTILTSDGCGGFSAVAYI